ncbi:diphosphate--fructose-6-phosphate 1-phosphotransferase [Bacillus solitudinis]|uniref:diphosphate--fructose-6-phosphate 1-phosphotransferase n=1 Tax=Bacillus solitudinis TaxID=2014074 RepID=UPI000C24AAA2|nr:diphosphate--fructose-6-phosphate 1-phosphotransferase [Bacillus solitudinis]
MKKIAIGQAGGPTSVINATLVGFVKQTMDNFSLTFIQNGYDGLVHGDFIEGNENTVNWVIQHQKVPGACLGSGRYPFSEEEIQESVNILRKKGIDALVFIGGNGTMEALFKVGTEACRQGYDLQIIGLPKTVDNDIGCTDHAPGFGSSAKYVAHTLKDLSRDLHSMKNFEQVRVLETMGRNAGWLAAASGLYKTYEEEGPHFIALPERELHHDKLLSSVETAVSRYGYAIVVVSEGVLWNKGAQIQKEVIDGRSILGGISKEIEHYLKNKLNLMVRSELLGMNQRSFSSVVSSVDQYEAYMVGVKGGNWVKEEKSDVMVSIERTKEIDYQIRFKPMDLKDVVKAGERMMPEHFIDNPNQYYEWLNPIVGGSALRYPPFLNQRQIQFSQ